MCNTIKRENYFSEISAERESKRKSQAKLLRADEARLTSAKKKRERANRWHARNVVKEKQHKRKWISSSITASNLLTETVEKKLNLLRRGTQRNFFVFGVEGSLVRENYCESWTSFPDELTLQVHAKRNKICKSSKRDATLNQFLSLSPFIWNFLSFFSHSVPSRIDCVFQFYLWRHPALPNRRMENIKNTHLSINLNGFSENESAVPESRYTFDEEKLGQRTEACERKI